MKWLKCCFTSTETVGLLGTGAQDVHLDFHTAPELCRCLMMLMMDDVGLNVLGCQDILGTNCNKLLKLKINGGRGWEREWLQLQYVQPCPGGSKAPPLGKKRRKKDILSLGACAFYCGAGAWFGSVVLLNVLGCRLTY